MTDNAARDTIPIVAEGSYRVHLYDHYIADGQSDGALLWFPVRAFGNALNLVTFYEDFVLDSARTGNWTEPRVYLNNEQVPNMHLQEIDGVNRAVVPLNELCERWGYQMQVLGQQTVILTRQRTKR